MARRTNIINAFKSHLETQLADDVSQVFKAYKYMDELNDFPAITFVARQEAREHRGAGRKMATLQISLRLYIYDRSIGELDLLTRKVEDAINTFTDAQRANAVEMTQVVTVDGDEGLMRPYQVADLTILITYDVEN